MRTEEFYHSRKQDWDALTRLVEKGQQDITHLSSEDIQTLARLYRNVTSDLALAQRDFPRQPVTTYLNQLVGRAHAVIYRSEPLAFKRLIHFATAGFPRLFRETFAFTLAAMLLFLVPTLLAGISTYMAPDSATWLLPAETQTLIPDIQQGELWTDIPMQERPYTSAFIMQNNIQVSFLAFASGITGGIMTVWVLVLNGLILGGITGLTSHYGIGFDLWTFVIGHGVIELSIICIAGGSGLMLGWALLRPGMLSRREALTQAAGKAVRLLLGAVPFLVAAGAIEGFISPAEGIPWPVKWGIGIGSGILFYSYLILAGREKKHRRGL